MSRLIVYNSVSLDGYFSGADGDLTWAYQGSDDPEWNAFVADNAQGGMESGGRLLFGRITYEMMASYWPTPAAIETQPSVAEGMNAMPKIVFSRTLKNASWSNTQLLHGNLAAEVARLKNEPGDIVVFGSGNLVSQLASKDLIDEYQLVVNPIVLGQGRTMFETLNSRILLKLLRSRTFANGKVFLSYGPIGQA